MKPNIIFMFSDQHRWDWMGCRGATFVHTPNLDRLAASGVTFTDAHCAAPLCGPSRMSMLTGRHPFRNEVWINEHPLATDVPTYAHALAAAGYETVLAGRMHFAGVDQNHGFTHRLTGDITRCYWGGPRTDYGPHAGCASSVIKATAAENLGPGLYNPVAVYDDAVTHDAVAFIERHARESSDTPLMMTVGWYAPHHPFMAKEKDYRCVEAAWPANDAPIPADPDPDHPWLSNRHEKNLYGELPADRTRRARINYAALIDGIDRYVGRILDAATKLPRDTIVVYSSDHGELAGDHGLWGKGCFFNGSVNVPLIVSRLGSTSDEATSCIASGATVTAPVSLLDIAPTFVELGGGSALPINDGASLASLLADPSAARGSEWSERPIFSELEMWLNTPIRMVRRGRYRYSYYHENGARMLFDLASDPHERHNLAAEDGHAALCGELHALLMDGWDPDAVHARQKARMADMLYLAQWGRDVGMGRLALWDQPTPPWRTREAVSN